MCNIKVSVIIPIYNVEHFIEHCVITLMRQTLDDVEYIFVNDAATDNSMEVLKTTLGKFPERLSQVKIIEHKQNKGLPAARNTGLSFATGEYIYHCDSDDYMELDALERMYITAKQKNADIVWCDYIEVLSNSEKHKAQPSFFTSASAIKAMLLGTMGYNVWNKLIKACLYRDNGIVFPEGYTMGEDLTIIILFACAKSVVYIPYSGYYYVRVNPLAVTRNLTKKKQEELNHNVLLVEHFLVKKYGRIFDKYIAYLKLNQKWPFLVTDASVSKYRMWNDWFTEANIYIKTQPVSFRMKLVEWAAWGRQYWFIWLHYWIVIRFFYSLFNR